MRCYDASSAPSSQPSGRIPVKGCSQSCGRLPNPGKNCNAKRDSFVLRNSLQQVLLSCCSSPQRPRKISARSSAEAKEILKTNETVVGGPLKYQQTDKPEITSLIVTIQPGGHSNLHQHPVVTFVHVLEGEAKLHIGEKILHYKAGENTWIEPIDTLNQLFNTGTVPLKNLVVFVGAEGPPNSIAAK